MRSLLPMLSLLATVYSDASHLGYEYSPPMQGKQIEIISNAYIPPKIKVLNESPTLPSTYIPPILKLAAKSEPSQSAIATDITRLLLQKADVSHPKVAEPEKVFLPPLPAIAKETLDEPDSALRPPASEIQELVPSSPKVSLATKQENEKSEVIAALLQETFLPPQQKVEILSPLRTSVTTKQENEKLEIIPALLQEAYLPRQQKVEILSPPKTSVTTKHSNEKSEVISALLQETYLPPQQKVELPSPTKISLTTKQDIEKSNVIAELQQETYLPPQQNVELPAPPILQLVPPNTQQIEITKNPFLLPKSKIKNSKQPATIDVPTIIYNPSTAKLVTPIMLPDSKAELLDVPITTYIPPSKDLLIPTAAAIASDAVSDISKNSQFQPT